MRLARGEAFLVALVLSLPALVHQIAAPVPRLDADAVEYYAHLRSLYFDHDVSFENEFAHFGILARWDKTNLTATGLRRTNFSVGPALLWLPFYAAGDLWARATGTVEDGYSPAHIRAVCVGSLVYGVAGLLLVYRLLRERFEASVAFWTTFLLLYATFLYWYLAYEPVMSHAASFFLAALALSLWWPQRDALSLPRSALLGLVLGLATTVRWQNAVLLLLPAGTLVLQLGHGRLIAAQAGALTLAGFCIGVLPQLLVFKAVFGTYLLPYPVQGRDYLRLDRPALLEAFFSSRHGLLFWTPVLWGPFLGYAALAWRDRKTTAMLAAPLVVMTYVNACSADWWAGGSYSNRRFDSVLPLLAMGLAACLAALQATAQRHPQRVLAAAGSLFVLWNLLFMEQYRLNWIPRDETISFARVAGNNASLIASAVGSPVAWPANGLFSWRHGLPPAKYDLMVGKYLFLRQNNLGGVIDLGDDRADPALLGEGWMRPQPCEEAVCRRVEGRARLFAPLDQPEALDVSVRAAGSGTLSLAVNGAGVAEFPLSAALSELRVSVPASAWRRELNEIAVTVGPGGTADIDRLVFSRKMLR